MDGLRRPAARSTRLPVRACPRDARGHARTSRWCTLTTEEEDESRSRSASKWSSDRYASFANGEPYPIITRVDEGRRVLMDRIRRPSRVGLDAGSRSSYEGRAVDALAQEADEGRGHLRKGPGSW
jgi:hypothetical protein